MKRSIMIVVGACVVGRVAVAQGGSISSQCPAGTLQQRATQDGCQKAIDIFAFSAPQLATGLVGGSATLGQSGALGGVGHFTIGIRGNVMRAHIARADKEAVSINGAVTTDYPVDEKTIPVPAIEGALGVFNGFPLGVTNVLALDVLASVTYVPDITESDVKLTTTGGKAKFGFGARVGLLQESIVTPSVAVSYLRRDTPTINLAATTGSDELDVNGMGIKTTTWRVEAAKNFVLIALNAGAGQDKYTSSADISVRVNALGVPVNAGPIHQSQDLTRTNVFGGVTFNLSVLKVAAEIGRASGGTIKTFNTFSGKRADDAITYVSLGLRLGI
jgi:hypothetical protein